jgi:hypothetical protein
MNLSVLFFACFLFANVTTASSSIAKDTHSQVADNGASCPCWNEQLLKAFYPTLASIRLSVGHEGTADAFDRTTYRMESCGTNRETLAVLVDIIEEEGESKHDIIKQCVYYPYGRGGSWSSRQLLQEGTPLTDQEYAECIHLLKEHHHRTLGGKLSGDGSSWDYFKNC